MCQLSLSSPPQPPGGPQTKSSTSREKKGLFRPRGTRPFTGESLWPLALGARRVSQCPAQRLVLENLQPQSL